VLELLAVLGLIGALVLAAVFLKVVFAILCWPFKIAGWILGGLLFLVLLPFHLVGAAITAAIVLPLLLVGLPIAVLVGVPLVVVLGLVLLPLLLIAGAVLAGSLVFRA
jgi:hypothetical protein